MLVQMIENVSKMKSSGVKPLFDGSSCYPLSPHARSRGENIVDKNDQLRLIFQKLGKIDSR